MLPLFWSTVVAAAEEELIFLLGGSPGPASPVPSTGSLPRTDEEGPTSRWAVLGVPLPSWSKIQSDMREVKHYSFPPTH